MDHAGRVGRSVERPMKKCWIKPMGRRIMPSDSWGMEEYASAAVVVEVESGDWVNGESDEIESVNSVKECEVSASVFRDSIGVGVGVGVGVGEG